MNGLRYKALPFFVGIQFTAIEKNPEVVFEVDLQAQTLTCPSGNLQINFEINPYKKHCLLNGLDDVDFLINQKTKIEAYERGLGTSY